MDPGSALPDLLQRAVTGNRAAAELALQPLLAYDREQNGDLLHTLSVYLATGGNASRSAAALYLHRSSLLYRIGRIEDLLGVELGDFETRVALEIAVVALRSS